MRHLLFAFLLLLCTSVRAQTSDIAEAIAALEDVTVDPVLTPQGRIYAYKLMVRQPVDHDNPSAGYFKQKVYVRHVGFDRPTVIITEGYNRDQPRPYELTQLLNANQVQVEHRYFGESIPGDGKYQHLNLKQATADLHHIRTLLADIYPQKWVSTGISKGGATTIFYRYFYPEDVAASVPYVAPINRAYEEPRLYTFLDTIGSDDCRKAIFAFQKRMLKQRKKILPLLRFYRQGARLDFNYITPEAAFEYAVMEYPFSFWQYGQDCAVIPDKKVPLEEALEYLLSVSGIDFFSDPAVEQYASHYYQSATEMGYYGYRTSKFGKLIKALPTDQNPMALFFPEPMNDPFNGQLLEDVNTWLNGDQANQIAYIYGGIDTWTGSAVPENDDVDAEWFFLAGKHHGNARIKSMFPSEKVRLVAALEKWLGMTIE